ncbi:MAG: hypothetical protein HKO57_07290 [Akkermansiaceae bacterium]|nr:hypothetical protein [Akkermansiaceae bacterium]
MGRCLRGSERALTILGLVYIGLHLFPQVLFAHSLTVEGITVHSRTPLPEAAAASIRKATVLLRESEVGDELGKEDVFICGSPWMLRVFNPRGSSGFGISTPLTNHVFIAGADFESDTARRFGADYNTRSLSGVIAHEVTHGLIRRRLGTIRGERLPT